MDPNRTAVHLVPHEQVLAAADQSNPTRATIGDIVIGQGVLSALRKLNSCPLAAVDPSLYDTILYRLLQKNARHSWPTHFATADFNPSHALKHDADPNGIQRVANEYIVVRVANLNADNGTEFDFTRFNDVVRRCFFDRNSDSVSREIEIPQRIVPGAEQPHTVFGRSNDGQVVDKHAAGVD